MLTLFARDWWILVVRGVFAVLFGVMAIVWPGSALLALVFLFGAFALVDGVLAVITAVKGRQEHRQWWLVLLEGLSGIAIGALTVFWPRITGVILLYLIVGWAIATGLLEIVAAILLRRELESEWLLALTGILSLLFGLVIGLQPGAGAVAIAWLIGIYAIVFGVLLIVLGFRLRSLYQELGQMTGLRSV